MLIHSGTITSQLPILAHTGLNMSPGNNTDSVGIPHWVIITSNDWISIMGIHHHHEDLTWIGYE